MGSGKLIDANGFKVLDFAGESVSLLAEVDVIFLASTLVFLLENLVQHLKLARQRYNVTSIICFFA